MEGKAHGTQANSVSTHFCAAHLHIQEEDIFDLSWVREGCKKDNSNSKDRAA